MTVGQKLHQCLTSIESASASLKNFALDTQDKNVQTEYNNYARQLEGIAQNLKGRINHVEQQEPQYKMK
jgi:hypothetical protein